MIDTVGVEQRLARAVALRDEARHAEAIDALGEAGNDPRLAGAQAMLAYEAWLPATGLLERALALAPGDRHFIRNLAGSLVADGRRQAGEAVLVEALARDGEWVDGQVALAQLRTTAGDRAAERGFAEAVAQRPDSAPLWLGWFQWLAKARRWDVAREVLDRAEEAVPGQRGLALSRLYLDAESGASRDPELFSPGAALRDPGVDLGRVRHALRLGQPEAVEAIATRHLAGPAGRMFWPYQSLAWRLLGDHRADWLDRPDIAIAGHDLGYDAAGLAALARTIRPLHVAVAPQIDQSVRGGTQTIRSLLLHHDPRIAELRRRIFGAVDDHVAALPPPVAGHPWLGPPRQPRRLAGSWSVRLAGGGHHVAHVHPDGWFSSALHLVVPDGGGAGEGALVFGAPPAELGLDLAPTRSVAPVAGTLWLFPSTQWHGTSPFGAGERLSVAFDIAVPRA